jgi:hypothetical protein
MFDMNYFTLLLLLVKINYLKSSCVANKSHHFRTNEVLGSVDCSLLSKQFYFLSVCLVVVLSRPTLWDWVS